jgi:hypothetical protein
MTLIVPTLIAASLLAAPAPADKPGFPDGPTPTIATVAAIDKDGGTCTLRTILVVQVTENTEVVEVVNGVAVKRIVTVTRLVTKDREEKVSIKDTPIADAEGNKVAEDAAWKRLTPGTTVVISADGNKVDPAYLAAFKKETLVLQPVRR